MFQYSLKNLRFIRTTVHIRRSTTFYLLLYLKITFFEPGSVMTYAVTIDADFLLNRQLTKYIYYRMQAWGHADL